MLSLVQQSPHTHIVRTLDGTPYLELVIDCLAVLDCDHSVPADTVDPVGLAHHAGLAHPAGRTHHVDLADDDEFADDDDDYVEYLVHRDGDTGNGWGGEDATVTEAVTEPLVGASPAARSTAADQPEWRSIAEQLLAAAEREDSGDGPTGHGRHSRAAD